MYANSLTELILLSLSVSPPAIFLIDENKPSISINSSLNVLSLEVFSLTLLHSVTHGRRRWKVYLSLLLSCNSAFLFLSFSPPLSSLHCTLYTHYTHTYTHAHTYNWLAPLLQGAYRAMTLVGSARLCTASRCWSVLVRLERFLLERVLLSSSLSYSSSVCQRFGHRHFGVSKTRARARRAELSGKKCDPSLQSYHPECQRKSELVIGPIWQVRLRQSVDRSFINGITIFHIFYSTLTLVLRRKITLWGRSNSLIV